MSEYVGLIIVTNLLLYFKTLRYKFVSDDLSVFQKPPQTKNIWHKIWLRFIGAAKYQNESIGIIRKNGKFVWAKLKTEEMEHLIALVLHIILCLLIFKAFGANWISFVAAMLYGTNAANNQGTIWPGGRGYVLPAISLLTAIAFPYTAIAAIPFCTWFTVGFLAPLALIGYKSPEWMLIFWLIFAWGINFIKFTTAIKSKAGSETFAEDARFRPRKIILAIKSFGWYLTFCMIPFRITFYHSFLQSCAGNSIMRKRAYSLCRYFWIGLIALISWAVYAWHSWDIYGWSFFAFMITIFPFCNLRRANQEIAERFAALPNVFLMFFLANVIAAYPALIAAFLAFYATRAYYTVTLYKDEYFITECAVIEDPHAWWAWHCRAVKRWDTGSYQEAMILWVMANLISPKEFKILMNLATVLRLMKRNKEADMYLAQAEANIVEGQEKQAYQLINDHKSGKVPIVL